MSRKLFSVANALYGLLGAGVTLEDGIGVLIMGGSSEGLGIEICLALAIDWNLYVVNVDTKDMEVILDDREAIIMDRNYSFVQCKDFTKPESVLEALTKVQALQLPLKLLINNMQHGLNTTFCPSFLLGNNAVSRLQEYTDSNVISVMVTTKYFMNVLVPQTRRLLNGKTSFYIINLTSILTLTTPGLAIEYISSKAALNRFHDGLTSELALSLDKSYFKTLLIFLPYVRDGHTWENVSTELCRQVIKHLKLGQRGCAKLHLGGYSSERWHGKIKENYRYKSGGWRPEWPS
ncbi:hypothetical protein HG536_0A03010 [Torulaspora globosa]|uniref:Ketoreductase (KR) domain-containing protein n=1 Tax=Torulaspora globosa TaxID=48254 RepID=A0A7G3ZAE8_9SACH|nr:uncharacterized protein HG536_0A03010 [Torulaspora globosa]QLL30484.1 hypothetical protein HG536_0A03010 [Torulaspora globosa]